MGRHLHKAAETVDGRQPYGAATGLSIVEACVVVTVVEPSGLLTT